MYNSILYILSSKIHRNPKNTFFAGGNTWSHNALRQFGAADWTVGMGWALRGVGRDSGVQRSSRSCSGHSYVLYLHQVFIVLFSLHPMYILNILLYQLDSLYIFIKGNTDVYQSLCGLSLIFVL